MSRESAGRSRRARAAVSTELHVFATGVHGYCLRNAVTHWPLRAGEWIREQGFLTSQP